MNLRQAAQQALEALTLSIPKPRPADDDYAELGWKEHNAAITALRAALAEPEQEPVATKQMMRWVEHLKRLSDDGQHMSIPGLSSGACWELAIELEQFIKNTAPTPHKPQTTHWEGCEAVHPECKTEHEVKDLSNYEFKTYKTGGAELEAGFYSTDELRDLVKELDKMNTATERSMRRMK